MNESPGSPKATKAQTNIPEQEAVRVRSDELLQGRKEIIILHRQEVYRLRLTRNDKLILYK